MKWNPHIYSELSAPRFQAALDLLNRIPLDAPETVYDLGCGTGNVTEIIATRWPEAHVTGLDYSHDMLEAARKLSTRIDWVQADLFEWRAPRKADVLFANATFQWLPDHATLFPQLLESLAPGGILALQMPRPFVARFYPAINDVIESRSWRDRLNAVQRKPTVEDPVFYQNLLEPLVSSLDIWETEYLHALKGDPHPVVRWTEATTLLPLLGALDAGEQRQFLDDYTSRIREIYPLREDGTALFQLKRIFIVAQAQ